MREYEELLKQYEEAGFIPKAKKLTYASWVKEHHPRRCPYCFTVFSVGITPECNHIIHCPICCMEIEYQKENE